LEEARKSLIGSLIAPSKAQSEAQKNAYTIISNGLKVHNESGELYVFGFSVSKKVIVEGTYKKVNSRELTLAKKFIQKECMKSTQYRQYKVTTEHIDTLSGGTETIQVVIRN
jgi:hypothetical protein